MRSLSSRYGDLTPEEYSDLNGIDQVSGLKALTGGNRGGGASSYADGISFRKYDIATDGFAYLNLPFNQVYNGLGRVNSIFQFFDDRLTFCRITTRQTTTSDNPPAMDQSIKAQNIFNASNSDILSETAVALAGLPSRCSLNGYDFLADGTQFRRIGGGSGRPISDVIQQGDAPSVTPITPITMSLTTEFGGIGGGNGQFELPLGLATDASGNIYVVDQPNNRVQVFNSIGVYQFQFGSGGSGDGQFAAPNSICVDGSGNIYVTDMGNNRVQKFDSSGAYVSKFGSAGSGDGQFALPHGICLDGSGNIYVVDSNNNRVQKFDSSGSYVSKFGSSGITDGKFQFPEPICIDGSGNLYVADTTNRIQKFDSSGSFVSKFGTSGSGPGQIGSTVGIALDGSGNIYVSDLANSRVEVFDTSGTFLGQFQVYGQAEPLGIAFNSSTSQMVVGAVNDFVSIMSSSSLVGGYYGYCYTLVDSMLNESQPSPLTQTLVAIPNAQVRIDIDIGDLDQASANWAKIRIYRTLQGTAPVLPSGNPTFYYVPGLDITIVHGTASYTTVDGTPDSTLTSVNNFQLTNVNYFNGQLAALPNGWKPKFIMTWLGVIFGCNWTDPNGVNYPRRVMWCPNTDNSQTSNGNFGSWNSLDYDDVGDASVGDILGCWPGLQGRAYVFTQNGTFLVTATGNSEEPYQFTQISNEYGFYHHSVDETTSGIIGMTKDGIAVFNGATYTHFSHPILKTLGTCNTPEYNSGIFDFNSQRYFVAVCDTSLIQSSSPYTPGTGTDSGDYEVSPILAYRNSVIIFDMTTKRFEIYRKTPIQIFSKFKDTSGKTAILAGGMSDEIYFITQGNAAGCNWADFVQPGGTFPQYTLLTSAVLPEDLKYWGTQSAYGQNDIYMPYSIALDNTSFSFTDIKDVLADVVATDSTLLKPQGGVPGQNMQFLVCIPNSSGVVPSTGSGTSFEDDDNYFLDPYVDGGTISFLKSDTLELESTLINTLADYISNITGLHSFDMTNAPGSGWTEGDFYILSRYRWVAQVTDPVQYYDLLIPSFGLKIQENLMKTFMNLIFLAQGAGPVRVQIFIDKQWNPANNLTPDEEFVFELGSPNMTQVRLDLAVPTGYTMNVRITGVRGLTKFEMNSVKALWAPMEAYSGSYQNQ